ncbi:hypothetical protein B0J14DRAFT_590955 [Halenospora varia]|nr:hypothetical protein B0J14DRAFT_590955 [Halenospora varia]
MRTCKKICEEGAEVFFKENEFDFDNCDEMYNYLYLIGEKCRGHIQRVLFDWDGVKIKESFQLLATLPKLEVLDIMPTYEISVEAMLNMGDKRARRADKHNNILWECNLKHAPGMDELQNIRGCKEVNLWQNGYDNHQHIEKIVHLLKKLLCRERQEVVATDVEEPAPEDTESSA